MRRKFDREIRRFSRRDLFARVFRTSPLVGLRIADSPETYPGVPIRVRTQPSAALASGRPPVSSADVLPAATSSSRPFAPCARSPLLRDDGDARDRRGARDGDVSPDVRSRGSARPPPPLARRSPDELLAPPSSRAPTPSTARLATPSPASSCDRSPPRRRRRR